MRVSAALFVVLLVVLTAGSGVAAQPPTDPAQGTAGSARPATTIEINLRANGDARWNVTTEFPLTAQNSSAAFDRLAADFEDGNADTSYSTDVFERIATRETSRTGRSMAITNVSRTTNATNETGRLTLAFTWTNFSQVEGNHIILSDVFKLDSGTWLPSLDENQRLIIRPPPGYGVVDSPNGIGVNGGVIDVNGSRPLPANGLSIRYIKSQSPPSTATPPPTSPFDWQQFPVIVVLLMAMGVGGLGVYVWTRRQGESDAVAGATADDGDVPPSNEPEAVDGAAAGAAEPTAEVAEELLSDEERVERLIAANGGRMMQANIVKETGWSNAKVSQLLSAMDDADRINKLRIGRENLITFPDEDVTEFK